ncbi:hypothetical protein L6452_39042 [Arctium lappa]|uniref:Uncharacterized protein n=1 Tax=Arctium lappa TaxID=4217 RepID=A0ACB8XSE2_ARCLA|nr:hypothetical protein L6452_39042 [Arctium lappa]
MVAAGEEIDGVLGRTRGLKQLSLKQRFSSLVLSSGWISGPLRSRAAKAIGFIDMMIDYSSENAPLQKELSAVAGFGKCQRCLCLVDIPQQAVRRYGRTVCLVRNTQIMGVVSTGSRDRLGDYLG